MSQQYPPPQNGNYGPVYSQPQQQPPPSAYPPPNQPYPQQPYQQQPYQQQPYAQEQPSQFQYGDEKVPFEQAFKIDKPKYNDLWAGILFLLFMAGFTVVSGIALQGYGPSCQFSVLVRVANN